MGHGPNFGSHIGVTLLTFSDIQHTHISTLLEVKKNLRPVHSDRRLTQVSIRFLKVFLILLKFYAQIQKITFNNSSL